MSLVSLISAVYKAYGSFFGIWTLVYIYSILLMYIIRWINWDDLMLSESERASDLSRTDHILSK